MALWRLTREAVHGGGGHVVEHERRRVVPLIRRSEVLDFLRPAQDAAVVQSRFRVPFALSKTETRRINAFDQRYMARWMLRFIPREGGRDLGCAASCVLQCKLCNRSAPRHLQRRNQHQNQPSVSQAKAASCTQDRSSGGCVQY
jgi:hypothetical protein